MHHFPPIQHQADNQKPREAPQLLARQLQILRRSFLKILPAQDRLVEYIRLRQIVRLARPQVLPVVKLRDPRRDLSNLPSLQSRFHELLPILLLEFPQLRVDPENLGEIRIVPRKREIAIRIGISTAENQEQIQRNGEICGNLQTCSFRSMANP